MAEPQGCPVAYCRGEVGHRELHDNPAVPRHLHDTPACLGREHDPACPNATWRRR